MTADELAAMIAEEIDKNSSARAILAKVQRGTATLADSERFTGITAEITGRLLADNVLSLPLSDRQGAFVDITAARYRDTFSVFSAVQRALDERLGINLAVVDPGFEKARAQKAGHALADQTVPESTVQRRAESAGENIVRSQHDRIVQKQAEFRDRAGLQCSAIREGGAKCCEWCASVSGKHPASDTPQGFWGRHDNCKCSVLYEIRKGVQRLGGSTKKREPLEDAGAPEPVRFTPEQAAELEAQHPVIAFTPGQAKSLQEAVLTNAAGSGTMKEREREFGYQYGERAIIADMEYISSEEYQKIFQHITDNPKVNSALLKCARDSISHRDGTKFEDMYFIHAETGEILASQTEMDTPSGVSYNDEIRALLERAKAEQIPLITLHNHPEGYPPSVDDLNKAFENGTVFGIASGHNGQVYKYDNPGKKTEKAEEIHLAIALLCQDGADPDRIYKQEYENYGLTYEILKGE